MILLRSLGAGFDFNDRLLGRNWGRNERSSGPAVAPQASDDNTPVINTRFETLFCITPHSLSANCHKSPAQVMPCQERIRATR
jgi:hypothetical protein